MGLQIGRIKAPWWAFAAVISLITMVLAGGVAIVATPAGCQAAQRAGLHVNIGKCSGSAVNSPVAVNPHASPTSSPLQSPGATPTFAPGGVPVPPVASPPEPVPSPYPPYEYPASASMPPAYSPPGSAPLPSHVTLACRLPIYVGPPGSGGFIVFPGGSFVADPRSNVTLPAGLPSPNPGYGGPPSFGLSYDRNNARWLPVPWNWVAPDGSSYVYPAPQGIYLIRVSDNVFAELGEGKAWSILAVDSQGVYATVQNASGLWLLPFPGGGAAREITSSGYWQAVGGGAAYGTSGSAVPQGVPNQILRLDLKTGVTVIWFMADAGQSQVIGFDHNGNPFILVNTFNPGGSFLWWVPSVGGGAMIAAIGGYQYQAGFSPNLPPIGGQQGTWFGGPQAIYLFIPNTGMYTVVQIGGQLAGDCA